MSILDAIGTAFEGSLFSRAVEPKTGAAEHEEDFRGTCLNCGTERVGHYCHACGQSAHIHRTIGAFMHDLLHGALHFEGKTWHTLPLLATKPGELTRRYIDGERARFVSPMALFLFTVFLMFAVFQIAGISPPVDLSPSEASVAQTKEEIANSRAEITKQLKEREEQLAQMAADDPARESVQSQIDGLKVAQQGVTMGGNIVATQAKDGGTKLTTIRTGSPFLDHGIEKWQKNPSLMLYKLQGNSYKFSWLLIPLSIPFVWLIFAWRRRFGPYDHAVFVTYSLSFMTLLFVVLTVLGQIGVGIGWLAVAGTTIPIWHIYRQLRGTYSLSRFSAVWRTIVLLHFILLITLLFVNVLLLLGAMG